MADIDSLIASVQQKMGDLITKPKMTNKVLGKPPFRFLHDTISAVTSTTGFGEGLYEGPELEAAAIADRDSKIAYLEKIFKLVGTLVGVALVARPWDGLRVRHARPRRGRALAEWHSSYSLLSSILLAPPRSYGSSPAPPARRPCAFARGI